MDWLKDLKTYFMPSISPVYDQEFLPLGLFFQWYKRQAENSQEEMGLALERENGLISTWKTKILPLDEKTLPLTISFADRLVKFLLWQKGAFKIYFYGPEIIYQQIKKQYSLQGERAFDVDLMSTVYQQPFSVIKIRKEELPEERQSPISLGGHFDGCRLGFDLGASDFKVAALQDGQVVFSEEIPWNPQEEADTAYHYEQLQAGLKRAAARLPRVEAIGGSAAGIYINNQVRIASLFRSVPRELFDQKVKNFFLDLQRQWGVPLVVINDGEVTALAGYLSLNQPAILGVAMGSSEAGGYIDPSGHLPGWLDELAFAPVDLNPEAARDDWSGDRGVGAMYFSQQAVNKLARTAGFNFPEEIKLPERLKEIQSLAEKGQATACQIFKDIGTYLGYTAQLYSLFYDYHHFLILGRVTSGRGGELIKKQAEVVLKTDFPQLAESISIHLSDEKSRRIGQAVAAATLPEIKR
ncbi:MAG TPA: ROK family protein [Candidatus Saccharicenans sp.]|nr:ROK family protein [Candidatus Saccharicenans sp.]HOL45529.1 ROK family protein [Candidatus Saccharicenans sp.]HOP60777.1 ROK family protein [Candidatus Saccharicenans sp.]HPC87309.1 ROK family protein [Candidatus Saccharicenans sp.]HPP24405.1 ROK family protein [Candidatus Saccharicenans sp.]